MTVARPAQPGAPLPTIDDVRAAAARIAGVAVRTPLLSSPALDERVGGKILLKCETLQRTGSFKFRGAYNAVSKLDPAVRARGVVAASSGNHAQAIAESARLFGVPATIVMPADAPLAKRRGTERRGARVVLYDRGREDRDVIAAELAGPAGLAILHPFNNPDVIAGQGTAGLEIGEDCRAMGLVPDAVLVPCSGGGLTAGVALAMRSAFPEVAAYSVEPAAFDDYRRSLEAGAPQRNPAASGSVCDALMSATPGAIGFALNRVNLRGGLVVTDDDALAAVAYAFRDLKLVVEPGGAAALAAILSGAIDARGRVVVAVLSGGNIDEPMLARALSG